MKIKEANQLIEELIEISDTKYGYLKIGRDTLNYDILFIEKYTALKESISNEAFENIDLTQLPKLKILKEIIKDIDDFTSNKNTTNKRMTQAVKAYKK